MPAPQDAPGRTTHPECRTPFRRRPPAIGRLRPLFAFAALLASTAPAPAEPTSQPAIAHEPAARNIRRIRGIIDRDDTWAGHIYLTDDTSILEAAVTIEPGTRIEFAADRPISLSIGTPTHDGRLIAHGTPAQQIQIGSHARGTNGHVIFHLHSDKTDSPAQLTLEHVVFSRLGHAPADNTSSPETPATQHDSKRHPAVLPALHIIDHDGRAQIALQSCTIHDSARVQIDCAAGTALTINNCRQDGHADTLALDLSAPESAGRADLIDNHWSAALALDAIPLRLINNRLIGDYASLLIRGGASSDVIIRNNVIRNTNTAAGADHYALLSRNPNARVHENIIQGGVYPVYLGTRHMTHNVILGALIEGRPSNAPPHSRALVHGLPDGAIFENNILAGPAAAHLCTDPLSTPSRPSPTIVRNNTFDARQAVTALVFRTGGQPRNQLAFERNLIVAPAIVARPEDVLKSITSRGNAFCPAHSFTRSSPAHPAQPPFGADFVELRQRDLPPAFQSDDPNPWRSLLTADKPISKTLRQCFKTYALPSKKGTPLSAGHGDRSESAPTIGASKP